MTAEGDNTLPGWLNQRTVLVFSVLVAGLCSLVYELLISTTASYFLGDTVKQFSITIGVYMAAMGGGSFLSRLITSNLLLKFIVVEIALGIIGGLSVPLLYACFAYTDIFYPSVLGMIIVIGVLTGLEVPLLTRIMEHDYELKTNLSNVLSLDYLGALLATLAFPFVLIPFFGIFKSAVIFGLINMGLGFLNLWFFADAVSLPRRRVLYAACVAVVGLLSSVLFFSQGLLAGWSESIYGDRVVYREQTPYQNIVLTRYKDDLRMYLDGHLQFSTLDEYRYHESLIHVPMAQLEGPVNVLMLGGGDGLAARELLKYERVRRITIVDLDPAIFRLARENAQLREANGDALRARRVNTIDGDALIHLQQDPGRYQLIVADLPDPKNASLARLYSREFYRLVRRHLTDEGLFVTQATSPFYANKAFWSVVNTLDAAGFRHVYPYHAYVPSFGDWGFVAASAQAIDGKAADIPVATRFLTPELIPQLGTFPDDLTKGQDAGISSLDHPQVLEYYLAGWRHWG